MNTRLILSVSLIGILAACSSKPSSRYALNHDTAPDDAPLLEHVEDPTPRVESLSRQGNRDYTVRGKDYQVWRDIKDYKVQGMASWYGKKFHGHLTSNGEIYDMYSMSAAHKNLPLPSYVKVTNLKNKRSVIVRVNDRGPFHEERLIDLSYAAAYRLDMLNSGTAKVEVELIQPEHGQDPQQRAFIEDTEFYIQLFASRDPQLLEQHQQQLLTLGFNSVQLIENNWHKLRLGPYFDRLSAEQNLKIMQQEQYKDAYIIKKPGK